MKAYILTTDLQNQLSNWASGINIYPDPQLLKSHNEYWESCGITEIDISIGEEIVEQNFKGLWK
jgi:hypothetical protein